MPPTPAFECAARCSLRSRPWARPALWGCGHVVPSPASRRRQNPGHPGPRALTGAGSSPHPAGGPGQLRSTAPASVGRPWRQRRRPGRQASVFQMQCVVLRGFRVCKLIHLPTCASTPTSALRGLSGLFGDRRTVVRQGATCGAGLPPTHPEVGQGGALPLVWHSLRTRALGRVPCIFVLQGGGSLFQTAPGPRPQASCSSAVWSRAPGL